MLSSSSPRHMILMWTDFADDPPPQKKKGPFWGGNIIFWKFFLTGPFRHRPSSRPYRRQIEFGNFKNMRFLSGFCEIWDFFFQKSTFELIWPVHLPKRFFTVFRNSKDDFLRVLNLCRLWKILKFCDFSYTNSPYKYHMSWAVKNIAFLYFKIKWQLLRIFVFIEKIL